MEVRQEPAQVPTLPPPEGKALAPEPSIPAPMVRLQPFCSVHSTHRQAGPLATLSCPGRVFLHPRPSAKSHPP